MWPGLAIIKLAQAYPRSRFVGYDLDERDVTHAAAAARAAGVADRVRFARHDASTGLTGTFDVVTTFDVLHDSVDPAAILRAVHAALAADGCYVCVDINCQERAEENVGPLATVKYAASLGYCLTPTPPPAGGPAARPPATRRVVVRFRTTTSPVPPLRDDGMTIARCGRPASTSHPQTVHHWLVAAGLLLPVRKDKKLGARLSGLGSLQANRWTWDHLATA